MRVGLPTKKARSEERAEVAAHLHDSVLQTLALIQKRADDPKQIAQLARRQERELREWLIDDQPSRPDERLADALRAAAIEIEDSHGAPIEAITVPEEIDAPASMVSGRRCYALRVRGRSMIDEGIFDGDYVVVEENPAPENGDTVVALIDGTEATLKRLYRERVKGQGRIRLQPANPDIQPIILGEDELIEIQGRVRGVLRVL